MSNQDSDYLVDQVLGDKRTETVSFSERQFEKLASLAGGKTSRFGAFWVSYEEDWIEGKENLLGFADELRWTITKYQDEEIRTLLEEIASLAELAANRNVPLIMCT